MNMVAIPLSNAESTAAHPIPKVSPECLDRLPRLIPRARRPAPENPLPAPETPRLPDPPVLFDARYQEPSRRILTQKDHETFLTSPSYSLILSFIFSLSDSAADKKISTVTRSPLDDTISHLLSILSSIEACIDANPPADQNGSRFGNPAFRQFLDSVSAQNFEWHQRLGVENAAIAEVSTYLHHSLGNRARIDYGSGHELNFIIWLLALNRISLLPPRLFPASVLVVFPRYIRLLRKIQATYYLEPAGSHGVWGLDDYHFLPFLFGASQLLHHPYIRPLAIHNELVLEEKGDDYLYLDMVRFTMKSKTVKGLKWTQPMLDDISGAKNWVKVETGMRRMFIKEVLGKLPVMQHFLFGTLVPAVDGMSRELRDRPESEETEGGQIEVGMKGEVGHVHRDNTGWGDCCGIKIPSTVAASREEMKAGRADLRRLPFD